MARKDEGPSLGWLYVGLGVVAAVGAGYMVWRYVLDESTKKNIKSQAVTLVSRGRDMAAEAGESALETGRAASRDAMARIRNP